MDLSDAKSIQLSDKDLFDTYFQRYPPHISELTFTNLFIWRDYYGLQFIEKEDHLLLFSEDFLGKWEAPINEDIQPLFFLPPIGEDPDKMIIQIFHHFDEIEFRRVPSRLIQNLQKRSDSEGINLSIQEDRDNWDYVYDKTELMELSGNKYRSKRRLLEKFQEEYDFEFHLVTEELLEKCRELQNKWCIINECQKNKDLEQEQNAIFELFDNFSALDVRGGLILVDDKPAGYTFGEPLNNNTSVIHLEKAHTYYEGSYQAINNLFLEHCCSENIEYINREQDLGVPGLRKAKQSYHPEYMVEKSIIH
jgi:hypothetical protein